MLIPPSFLRTWFGVRPQGVLHVGAHLAEEFALYKAEGFGKTLWVEAQESLIPEIREAISESNDEVYQGAIWSETGKKLTLRVTSNSASTSLYPLGEHREEYPTIVVDEERTVHTIRLDELIPGEESFDFVTLDIQGAELEALRSMGDRINSVKWVYTEVNKRMLYEGIALVSELDQFLGSHKFHRVASSWTKKGWGDALYTRDHESIFSRVRNSIGFLALMIRDALGLPKSAERLKKKVFRKIDRLRGFEKG